ncbi:MAG: hypothetical protein KDA60_00045 [Planctomycetales bacterium]|nr:hypothetical protein [Planctomycetales bacterium]
MRNPQGGTAAEVLQAKAKVRELAGREYADRVRAGTENEVPKEGKIKESEDSLVDAKRRRDAAEDKVKQQKKKKQKLRSPRAGVGIAVSEAEGSLLGAQVDVEVGLGLGYLNVSKKVGTLQVTLPDVNLRDQTPNAFGQLSASTDSFPRNSELDKKRQIAQASLDLASMIPVIPGGEYNISAGPLSLDVTAISYDVGPQLNVTQDVQASPITRYLTYDFYTEAGQPANVLVSVNGVDAVDDESILDDVNGRDTVSTWKFFPGQQIEIETAGTAFDGQVIEVRPRLEMSASFTNDIGLDVDIDGVFDAFALQLSAFGTSLLDIGPLIHHAHTFATFDLGSVFKRSWNLELESFDLAPFKLFNRSSNGVTAATAYMTAATATPREAEITGVNIASTAPVWFASSLIDPAQPDTTSTSMDVTVSGTATLQSLQVIDDRLTVTDNGGGQFTISGFTANMLAERKSALFVLTFSSAGTVYVTTVRSASTESAPPAAEETDNLGVITDESFEKIGVSAVLNLDIDDDGIASPLTDGILLIRHLAGFQGEVLVAGAIGPMANRTDPIEIADYIDRVLEKALPVLNETTGDLETRSTLDFDGNGQATALNDGLLFTRYLAGFTQQALVNAATNASADDVLRFLRTGRSSASNVNQAAFAEVIDRLGLDVLGLDGIGDADQDDGSSAAAGLGAGVTAGSAPSFAMAGAAGGGAGGSSMPSYDFDLTLYNQLVVFHEISMDGTVVSRTAEGSPLDFGSKQYAALANRGIQSGHLASTTDTARLGVEEPLFIKAPDAVAYEYESLNGFTFETIVIDPEVGGNLLLPSEFDLYLFNEVSGMWEFSTTLSGDNPAHVGANGYLTYTFPGGPVPRFQLYSHAFRNEELNDEENLAAAQTAELTVTTGLILAEPAGGSTFAPQVRMTQLASRLPFTHPELRSATTPVHLGAPQQTDNIFELVREGANVLPTVNGQLGESFQMVAAAELKVFGHDNVDDTVILNSSGGPLHMPLEFYGGFRHDSLVIDSVNGQQLTIDLASRDLIREVELIDIRGLGGNTLRLDYQAVESNDPYGKTLQVRANSDDTVDIGAGWADNGTENIDSVSYRRFTQRSAILFVEDGATIVQATTEGLRLLVPAYANPCCNDGPDMWDQLIATASDPQTSLHIIFNPASGPGLSVDPNYVDGMGAGPLPSARDAGATIYGYVASNYAGRSLGQVQAEIDAYFDTLYTGLVDGIFIDEMSNDLADVGYYEAIRNYVKAKSATATVIMNPGTSYTNNPSGQTAYNVDDYAQAADVLITFEASGVEYGDAYVPPSWVDDYVATRFGHIVHSQFDWSPDLVDLAKSRNAGWLFVTNDGDDGNPYDRLASYWTHELADSGGDEFAALAPSGGGTGGAGSDTRSTFERSPLMADIPITFAEYSDSTPIAGGAGGGTGLQQVIGSSQTVVETESGAALEIPLTYEVSNAAATTGLQLRMHFDSSKVSFVELTDVLPQGYSAVQMVEDGPCSSTGCTGLDGDPATDRYINIFWMDPTGHWPSAGSPQSLFTARFMANEGLEGVTHVRFTGTPAAGYTLIAAPIVVSTEALAAGDFNADGEVNDADIDLLSAAIRNGATDAAFDLNGDDAVSRDDHSYLVSNLIGTLPGDANLDGQVDATDFNAWNLHRMQSGTGWATGDFNADGVTDVSDFNLWNAHKFRSASTSPQAVAASPRAPLSIAATTLDKLEQREKKERTNIDSFFASLGLLR